MHQKHVGQHVHRLSKTSAVESSHFPHQWRDVWILFLLCRHWRRRAGQPTEGLPGLRQGLLLRLSSEADGHRWDEQRQQSEVGSVLGRWSHVCRRPSSLGLVFRCFEKEVGRRSNREAAEQLRRRPRRPGAAALCRMLAQEAWPLEHWRAGLVGESACASADDVLEWLLFDCHELPQHDCAVRLTFFLMQRLKVWPALHCSSSLGPSWAVCIFSYLFEFYVQVFYWSRPWIDE